MKRRISWITLCAALIIAGITAAWTQTQTWRGAHGPLWFRLGPMGYIARELDLSDNQKSQIKTIWGRPNISELVHELASEQKEMDAQTFQNGTPDVARLQEITARQGATLVKLLAAKEMIAGRV